MKLFTRFAVIFLLACLIFQSRGFAAEGYTDGTKTLIPYGLNAQRIVCLAPNCTEMLWYVGLGNKQVARTDYCNYPLDVVQLPSIGGFADTSLEAIVAIRPDLVVAYQGNSLELVSQLRELHIQVLAFAEAQSVDAIGEQMAELYMVAGPTRASTPKKISDWRLGVQQASAPTTRKALKVFYGYPGELAYTCGKGSFINDLILRAGGSNVVDLDDRWPAVSAEYIVSSAPDVLLTATNCTGPKCEMTAELERISKDLKATSPWNSLPAVKKGRIIVVDADVMLRPGPRSLDALKQVRASLQAWSN